MVDFIRTEHNPPIFYRPKGDNPESETRKNATKAKIMGKLTVFPSIRSIF